LCYRLDGNPKSVNKEFFDKGNEIQREKYRTGYPWTSRRPKSPGVEIGPGIKIIT
jgi:hypothetical protein